MELTELEKDFARPFLGKKSDRDIAKMMHRAEKLIRDYRHELDIPPKPSGAPRGPKPGKLVLCGRCQIVKFESPLDREGEPVKKICRWCG